MLQILAVTLIILNVLGLLLAPYSIDKPRGPLTAGVYMGQAIITVINIGLLVVAIQRGAF